MGRTKLFAHDTDDDTSSQESDVSMDSFLTDLRPLRFTRLRTRPVESAEPSTSEVASVQQSTTSRSTGIGARLRRRVAESRSNSSTTSASNSPRRQGPTSPKLPRLSTSSSSLFSPRNRTIVLSDTSPSPLFSRRGRNRRPAVNSDEEQSGAAMNTGTTTGGDEEGAARDSRLRRRATRLWASTTGRRPNATASSNDRRPSRQQQLDTDEAYARRLQAQYDAQFQAEQQQRRRREAVALRRQMRAQANSFRPLTPPLPPRMRDFVEVLDDDDDDDEDSFDVRIAIANILGAADAQDDHPRRRGQRRGSPSGPTTLATVRRYYREAHLDANLFPDINISVMDFEALLELADEIGDVTPSMSATEINRLPTSVYRQNLTSVELVERADSSSASSSSGSTSYSDEAPNCAICMEKFSDGDVQRNLPCFHAFHKDCVDVWLKQKSSCPVCRVDARRTSPLGSP